MEQGKHLDGGPQQRRTARYFDLIVPILVILGISIFAWNAQSDDVGFRWSEKAVSVTDPAGDTFEVRYADVISMTLEDRPDLGRCLVGESQRSWIYGTWENDVWGTYRLLVTPDAKCCIVFRTAQMCCVLNYESDKTTRALYEQLVPIIKAAQS